MSVSAVAVDLHLDVPTASFPASSSLSQHPLLAQLYCPPSEISDARSRGRQRKDALAPGKEFSFPVRSPHTARINQRVAGPLLIPQSPTSPARSSPLSSTQDLISPRTMLLTPSTASSSPATTPSSYLHYQPGLHATAGPLPPPPQAVSTIDSMIPPPRPPRQSPMRTKDDPEAMKQALQLPPHVIAALTRSSKRNAVFTCSHKMTTTVPPSSPPPTDSPSSSHESLSSHPKPHHVREGAFPPSRVCTLDPEPPTSPHEDIPHLLPRFDSMDDLVASIGLAIDNMGIMSASDVPPPTVVEPPRGHEGQNGRKGLEIRRADNLPLGLTLSRSRDPDQLSVDHLPSSPRSEESAAVPPVPAKNDHFYLDAKSLKNALNIKRFSSLPRTPSLMSLSRPSVRSKRSSGTPSPSVSRPKPPTQRTKSACPSAMYFADVTVKRTALERSIGYARKINELYNYDCGLGDWIVEARHKALHPHSSGKRSNVNSSGGPRAPSTSSPSIAPRHISQSSTDSGVTFPRRADAYSATDLSPRAAGDASSPNAPPPLPYPALAAPRPSRASTMIATSSSSSSRSAISPTLIAKSPGSFLVSLGRRASMRKEKSLTPPTPAKTLSRSPPRYRDEQLSPRPANIPPVAPSVPGGPRAPPNRMQRSQTIIITSQNSTNGTSHQRSNTMTRRPSLFDGPGNAQQQNSLISGTEFNRQVDKLVALLPKADRNVLAMYLRRAGQDIRAIGQYLEDEKNGTRRYQ